MTAQEQLRAAKQAADERRNGNGPTPYTVLFDDKGKLLLPEMPAHNDPVGLCAWLTCAFNLNLAHPITGGCREGLRGPDGHVNLTRAGAQPIRFEPATKINTPGKLIETLSWRMEPTDGAIHALTGEHCRLIAHAVRMLCGLHDTMTETQEADAIIGTFLQGAVLAEGDHTTYGTPAQRYEAAIALRRDIDEITGRQTGPPRYLIDTNTGEYVVAVSDLQDAARRTIGSSLPRGWLDARLETLDWARITLQGYGQPGRSGRQGPHARIFAYRGHLPAPHSSEQIPPKPVNT